MAQVIAFGPMLLLLTTLIAGLCPNQMAMAQEQEEGIPSQNLTRYGITKRLFRTISTGNFTFSCQKLNQPVFLNKHFVCDGIRHCDNGLDEESCTRCSTELALPCNQRNASGGCYSLAVSCDIDIECSNGRDEHWQVCVSIWGHPLNTSNHCNLGLWRCSANVTALCGCPPGFKSVCQNGLQRCEDINECQEIPNLACSGTCINLKGSFTCEATTTLPRSKRHWVEREPYTSSSQSSHLGVTRLYIGPETTRYRQDSWREYKFNNDFHERP